METNKLTASDSGGLESASRTSREMATWEASSLPMNVLLQFDKNVIDDRARDVTLNDGYAAGAIGVHKNSIVGTQYKVNSQPDADAIGIKDENWLFEFQQTVESRFNNTANSSKNWLDASRVNDFTALVRQAVGCFVLNGEVLATLEWITEGVRPYATAVQMISPRRLSNPDGLADDEKISGGIERDKYGRAVAYHITKAHPFDFTRQQDAQKWVRVEAETKWGRMQVIHIMEQLMPDQIRGVSEMMSVLKQMHMTRRFQDIELQQAILQATYAASIESDLPPNIIAEMMGSNPDAPAFEVASRSMLSSIVQHRTTNNLQLNGVQIPIMHPNTKLNLQQLAQPTGTGSEFEQSLLRKIAAGLGLSYEMLSQDYSKTNYSSIRAAMNETQKFMQARKKTVADRFANCVFRAWLEEQIQLGMIPMPKGKNKNWIYESPEILDALSKCSWIGASKGQIDPMKESQASILRINAGLSTLEDEAAAVGKDWREILRQRQREIEMAEKLGVPLSDGAEKPVVSKKPTEDSDSKAESDEKKPNTNEEKED